MPIDSSPIDTTPIDPTPIDRAAAIGCLVRFRPEDVVRHISRRFFLCRLSLALAVLTLLGAGAVAQDIPADQSCGGLLCDMGVLGHKVAPPPPVAPAPAVAPAPPVAMAPAAETPRRKPRVARKATRPVAASAAPAPARAVPVAVAPPPPAPPPSAPRPSPAVAAPSPALPESQRAGPAFIFQSVDPRFQMGD